MRQIKVDELTKWVMENSISKGAEKFLEDSPTNYSQPTNYDTWKECITAAAEDNAELLMDI